MDNNRQLVAETIVTPELYFLISKFLAAGPLQETAEVLVRELENKKVLPKRTDWLGNEHEQSFAELEQKYGHISANHLLDICCRISPILDKELTPSVPGIISLLGAGRQSLLRTKESIYNSRSLLDYCTRVHGVSLPDSSLTKPVHNLQKVLIGREYGGPVRRKLLVPTSFYNKTKLLRRTVGHLSSVYCVLFDRTGRYIITGADDLLIKIWSAVDGRLLATLRGASAEITDIAINLDNTMLAAGSLDRILRVWDMQTTSPIAVLTGHTGMITSVNFCPSPRGDMKYLVTTSTDGSIAFWQYSTPRGQKITFGPKPIQYHEKLRPGQAQMMCTSFSPGGIFLAAGSADHHVRVYIMSEDGPKRILESEAYTDAVDSVQWSHRGLRFISGSKDGTAHIWTFESQQWKSVKLCMTERLQSCPEAEEGKKLKVTMVAWDCSDRYVITAVNDFTIKIWNSKTAKLHCVLRGHKDELYVLESNPKDEHVLLSAGHDGQVFLWDIEKGVSVAHFLNDIDGQGHGGVFDAKWSPDGTMIAATDSHGHLLIFGLGIGPDKYKLLPSELFFHTDYRPLLRDASHHVVDEQTQIMPHLMPPPFLVDAEGNPHPAKYQRYVPGRENCSTDQLIPNLTVGPDGVVIEDNLNVSQNGGNFSHIDRLIAALANRQGGSGGGGAAPSGANNPGGNHSQLDRLIEALANRQGQDQAPDSNNRSGNNRSVGNVLGNGSNASRNDVNPATGRRFSDVSNASRQGIAWGRAPEQQQLAAAAPPPATLKYIRRIYVRPMKYAQLQNLKQSVFAAGQFELLEYRREMRRRPIMINTSNAVASLSGAGRQRTTRSNGGGGGVGGIGGTGRGRIGRRRTGQQQQPAYRTRAVRGQEELEATPAPEEEEEDEESSGSSGDTSYSNVEENLEESSEESDTESSEYSDWVADTPGPNLEPPKRSKRKPLSRRHTYSDESSDETTEQPSTSAGAAAKASRRNKRVVIPPPTANGEIPELYRPAEWLSEVIPRKAPYYPQMGDEVVYFRQGHQRYLEAVRQKKVYKLSHSSEPWNFRTLRDHELVRVIGIKYEIRPPRLCCLKLAIIDRDGNMTGPTFKIKYHDMPDVLDFLVLRQTFDLAVQRNWSIGDRFRCMIGDGWWMGQIESRHPLSSDFPDSFFMCFRVRWDNGEYEYMSPWDMEPIDENRLPDEVGGAVPVLPEEIRATLYQPKSEEWQRGDRDGSCRRIINGLEQVMRLSIAEHFLAPVDLSIYPDYAYFIEYPIDLTTIKSRFENHFYRRITSAQFDVRYLATNAEKYNRSHTNIVKHARIITDLCLRIIRESNDIDVAAVYHQLVDVYHSSESENDNESDVVPSTSTGPSTSAAARQRMSTTRRSQRIRSDGDWRSDCRQLLEMMWQRPDSVPFREPVDTIEFPDYLEIISTPMDLRTVKEDLLGGNYDNPLDFAKDVRLIFQNSKNYNTNKRSRIYSMTLRLSALFESHMKTVITNWKAARRRANKGKPNGRGSSSSPTKRTPPERSRASVASKRGKQRVSARMMRTSEDDNDDDDDEDEDEEAEVGEDEGDNQQQQRQRQQHQERPSGSQRRLGRRNGLTRGGSGAGAGVGVVASTSGSNRVTSSSSHRRSGGNVRGVEVGVSIAASASGAAPANRRSHRKTASQELQHSNDDDDDDDEDDEEEEEEDDDNSSSSSSEDEDVDSTEEASSEAASNSHDDSDDDNESRNQSSKRGRVTRKRKKHSGDEDSEESYKPDNLRSRRRLGRSSAKRKKSNKKKTQQSKRRKRQRIDDDDDEDYATGRRKRRQTTAASASVGVANETNRSSVATAVAVAETNGTRPMTRRGRGRLPSSEEDMTANTGSQVDESTQDTVSNTPKKKGRPPKSQAATALALANGSGSSGSANAAAGASSSALLLLQSPSRNTRNQVNGGSGVGGGGGGAASGRRNATENDHSYHLPVRNGRIAESDTDSREMATGRPTRSSFKRAILEWARSSDVEEDSEEAEEILPTPTPTKSNPQSVHSNALGAGSRVGNGPSTSRGSAAVANGVVRQLRTNRNTIVEPQDEEDDDDSDDNDGSDNQPLVSSVAGVPPRIASQHNNGPPTRSTTSTTTTRAAVSSHALALEMQRPHAVAISASVHMTRSHATSTTTTTLNNVTTSSPSTHDHNYLGDSARPSTSSAALRNSRRVLSRHQRNADELDISLDPLENTRLLLAATRLRRGMPTSTSTNNVGPSNSENAHSGPPVRRGRSRYSQENSQSEANHNREDDDDDEEEEEEEDSGASDEGTDGGSSTHSGDASDSDDNQPLTSYVPKTRQTRNHTKQLGSKTNHRRRRRRRSDDSFVCDEDDDDYDRVKRDSRKRHSNPKRHSPVPSRRKQRGSRNQKRPRYNEESDEDAFLDYAGNRKRVHVGSGGGGGVGETEAVGSSGAPIAATSSSSSGMRSKNLANNVKAYDDDDDESTVDSDEQLVSVSSRGRVRKITAKARGIFKE